ncbi:MAG: hypothetical protein HYU66_19840, partial [Armatimonadetes bacterium]|nr:hypothetical protein [Armatimonadota bacterium]
MYYAEPLLHGRRAVLRDLAASFDEGIVQAARRYPEQVFGPPPRSEVASMLVPEQRPWSCKHTAAAAQNALLTVSLALRAWRLEHAGYPERLTELVPEYLPGLPADPFALSGPLGYRREGERYVLWSIGPDGRDNRGQQILDSTQNEIGKWLTRV